MKHLILILLLFFCTYTTHAQSYNDSAGITGNISDKDGDPMINTSIELFDNNKVIKSTVSDFDGNYVLKPIVQNTEYYMRIKAVGYIQQAIPIVKVTNDTTIVINVQLKRDPNFKPFSSPCNLIRPALIDIDNPSPMNRTFTSDEINRTAH